MESFRTCGAFLKRPRFREGARRAGLEIPGVTQSLAPEMQQFVGSLPEPQSIVRIGAGMGPPPLERTAFGKIDGVSAPAPSCGGGKGWGVARTEGIIEC